MKKILLTFFITMFCQISLLASCSSCQQKQEHMNPTKDASTQSLKSCICPKDFNPVCGSDQQTYSNACSAGCAGVKILHEGPCPVEKSQE